MQRDDQRSAAFPGIREWSGRRDDDAHVRSCELSSQEVRFTCAYEGHFDRRTRDRLNFLLELQKTSNDVGVFHVDNQRQLSLCVFVSDGGDSLGNIVNEPWQRLRTTRLFHLCMDPTEDDGVPLSACSRLVRPGAGQLHERQ